MEAVVLIVGALAGIILGFFIGTFYQRKQAEKMLGSAEHQSRALLDDARRQAETTRREAAVEARDEALRLRSEGRIRRNVRVVTPDRRTTPQAGRSGEQSVYQGYVIMG